MDRYKQLVKEYYEKYNKKALIALKVDNKIIMAEIDKTDITVFDFDDQLDQKQLLVASIFRAKRNINALIFSSLKYTDIVSKAGVVIPPLLDDLAQIVGPSVRCVKGLESHAIIKKLSGRNACLIKDSGAIATGRTLDEADIATLVLEKGAKAFIESTVIGVVKPIKRLEAMLMHIIYKKKYSKTEQTTKIKEMQND